MEEYYGHDHSNIDTYNSSVVSCIISWTNVIANGGLPGLVVILTFLEGDWENGVWLFTASVAVAASDTFASEIGCMDKRVRMITTFKKCEPGINGGFSPNGQLAAALGAFTMGMMALALYWLPSGHFVADGVHLCYDRCFNWMDWMSNR